MQSKTTAWLLALGWAVTIAVLSLLPGRDLPKVDIMSADKIAHFSVYAILAVLFARVVLLTTAINKPKLIQVVLICSFYGVLLEFAQDTFVPSRYFDWQDALANATGSLILFTPLGKWLTRLFTAQS